MNRKCLIILIIAMIGYSFQQASNFSLELPDHFPEPNYPLVKDSLSKEKVELGRMLFYDPILSRDNSISCASCHSPYNAFAHTDHDLSHGIDDQIGTRNAPALFNLAWQKLFMWDGAINHIDIQPLAPISHPKEMDEDIANVVEELQNSATYRSAFYAAFSDSKITSKHLLKALSQFQLTLISAESKYDEVKKGSQFFTDQEQNGYRLFKKYCNSCHTEPLFSTYGFANNGLPADTTLNDYGRWMITKLSADSMMFKIPSLRNLSYSYPYMHDGRFKKLQDVLNHYTGNIVQNEIISDELKEPIVLTSNEKVDLIAFLLTLNDKKFIFNPQHQFPKTLITK